MEKAWMFCNPGDAYKNVSKGEAAARYSALTEDYDSLVSFEVGYNPEAVDLERIVDGIDCIGWKEIVFAEQPVTAIGALKAPFTSTSYLFAPLCKPEYLTCPGLDIVELNGKNRIDDAVQILQDFYETAGWETALYRGEIKTESWRTTQLNNPGRFLNGLTLASPEALLRLAEKKIGFSRNKFCFKV